jgi:hypothetical protein
VGRLRGRLSPLATAIVAASAALLAVSCASTRAGRAGRNDCAVLDSLLAAPRGVVPATIAGHATVDADQFRMRGKILLEARSPRDIVFEFTSTVLFGQEREDFVFSLAADTLRIIDREHGAYLEGDEAVRFLAESLDADFDVAQALSLAFGGHPPCAELSETRCAERSSGSVVCDGKRFGKPFATVFGAENGRVEKVEWPVESARYGVDRLRVEYEWGESDGTPVLGGVVLTLEARGWRCKIRSAPNG